MSSVARADDALGEFIAALEAKEDNGAVLLRRMFRPSKPVAHEALPERRTQSTTPRTVLLADAGASFERWQREANERLKYEMARETPKQHPLAAAHPSKSVVVCEAGCGGSTADSIVYVEPVVPAVLPDASGGADASSSSEADPASVNLADGELPCIAGCYVRANAGARTSSNEHGALHRDDAHETAIVLTANSPRMQAGRNGSIVDVSHARRKITSMPAADFYDGWRTKIVFPRSSRSELLGRAWQRQIVRHDRIILSDYPDAAQ